MKDNTGTLSRKERLSAEFKTCAERVSHLQKRLMTEVARLKPIELERLLDDYRAEQIRYDNLSRELDGHDTAAKTAAAKERWRKQNRDRRKKLHY